MSPIHLLIISCVYNYITDELIEGKSVTVTGWGNTAYNGKTSDFLKEAPLTVWTKKRCDENFKNSDINYDITMFCAFGNVHDACQVIMRARGKACVHLTI